MDKQPSAAAVKAANDFAGDPDNAHIAYGAVFIDGDAPPLALDAYAAVRERVARRDALEQACEAIERAREWARPYLAVVKKQEQATDYIRGMDKAEEYIRALMSEPEEAKSTGVVHRYAITRVDDFGDAWQVHWEGEDHGGRATIAKLQLPGCAPTPGATVELSFDVLGGFLGGRIINQIVEATP